MHLWRKLVTPRWLIANEADLRFRAGKRLAVIEWPARKKLALEVVCKTLAEARRFARQFGGQTEKIPRDWLKRFFRASKKPPLRVGRRLIITNMGVSRRSPHQGTAHLVIPAGSALGTGEHVTTAMSLRLLELITRGMKNGWSVADLGTGSGILALAAHRFGAGHVFAIDNDPRAIATAKANARLNKIGNIKFQIADAGRWRPRSRVDILVANLFSELLIQVLPRWQANLKRSGRLILSGVLRTQEREVSRILRLNRVDVVRVRRRGKWIAFLAKPFPSGKGRLSESLSRI
jgi:ribosomal protein L11 methyltransferase